MVKYILARFCVLSFQGKFTFTMNERFKLDGGYVGKSYCPLRGTINGVREETLDLPHPFSRV